MSMIFYTIIYFSTSFYFTCSPLFIFRGIDFLHVNLSSRRIFLISYISVMAFSYWLIGWISAVIFLLPSIDLANIFVFVIFNCVTIFFVIILCILANIFIGTAIK